MKPALQCLSRAAGHLSSFAAHIRKARIPRFMPPPDTNCNRPAGRIPSSPSRLSSRLMRAPWARPRRTGPGCRASHRAAARLDPDGLPSLAQHGEAGCAGGDHEGGPSRGRGSRALMSVAGTRPTVPLDELARCSRTARRSTALRFASCAARVPDRHPGHPPRQEPGRPTARLKCSGRLDRRAVRCARWHVGRRGANPRDVGRAARVAPAGPSRRPLVLGPLMRRGRCPDEPIGPAAIPQASPPSLVRGTCWGIFNAVGRATGSPLSVLAMSHWAPH